MIFLFLLVAVLAFFAGWILSGIYDRFLLRPCHVCMVCGAVDDDEPAGIACPTCGEIAWAYQDRFERKLRP